LRLAFARLVFLAISLGAAVVARADLSPVRLNPGDALSLVSTHECFSTARDAAWDSAGAQSSWALQGGSALTTCPTLALTDSGVGSLPARAVSASGASVPAASQAPTIRALPPSPGSAGLFLSGVLSLGAWRRARSVRIPRLAGIPDWCCAVWLEPDGEPVPVDRLRSLMPLCAFETPDAANGHPSVHHPRRETTSRLNSQFLLPASAPRGPPLAA
jgi:hypothetical protein